MIRITMATIAKSHRVNLRSHMASSSTKSTQMKNELSMEDSALLRNNPTILPTCAECDMRMVSGFSLGGIDMCDSCIETLVSMFNRNKQQNV